jgi:hypothetical protein
MTVYERIPKNKNKTARNNAVKINAPKFYSPGTLFPENSFYHISYQTPPLTQ